MSALRPTSLLSSNHSRTSRSPYAGRARRGSARRAIHHSLRIDTLAKGAGQRNDPVLSRCDEPAGTSSQLARRVLLARRVERAAFQYGGKHLLRHLNAVLGAKQSPIVTSRSQSGGRRSTRPAKRTPSPGVDHHIAVETALVRLVLFKAFISRMDPRTRVSA